MSLLRLQNLDEVESYLTSFTHKKWRGGLDRFLHFIDLAGLADVVREQDPKYVHITGTNGKGSVTAYVQKILTAHGFQTGGFFSPYVYDLRERWQINSRIVSTEDLITAIDQLYPAILALEDSVYDGLSEFEIKTAIAFQLWKNLKIDWVALEVGIGGRLDTTNVVVPACSVIVSIGLDHCDLLGDTEAKIAWEKAQIIKPNAPAVIGKMSTEAREVIRTQCEQTQSSLYQFGNEFGIEPQGRGCLVWTPSSRYENIHTGIPGKLQSHNAALAIMSLEAAGLELEDAKVRSAVQDTRIPGRFERRYYQGKVILLDGAHNSVAAQGLIENLQATFPGKRLRLVTAMLQGHDPSAFLSHFSGMTSKVYATQVQFYRSTPCEELHEIVESLSMRSQSYTDPFEAFQTAHAECQDDEIIVVTGSFYLLSEINERL